MAHKYYLSLGSNISPEYNLPQAVDRLRQYGRLLAVSSVYETPALGTIEEQPNYLNAIVLIESDLIPIQFQKNAIASVESSLRRIRTTDKFAARTIDIDIMLVDTLVLMIEHRKIPSEEIVERNFVAIPLAEIAPDFIHPELHQSLGHIASTFRQKGNDMKLRTDIDLTRFTDENTPAQPAKTPLNPPINKAC